MEKSKFRNFDDFWPYYLSQHKHVASRRCHFAGTASALSVAALGVLLFKPKLLVAAVVVGYAWAWVGHFYFEKNRPATFSHPVYSLRGDWKMFRLMLRGDL